MSDNERAAERIIGDYHRRQRRVAVLAISAAVGALLLVFAAIAAVAVLNYDECRAHGFSRSYCLTAGGR